MTNNVTINVTGNSSSAVVAIHNLDNAQAGASKSADKLRAALVSLAPAAIPIVAAAAPLAEQLGAAGVAAGAFTLAIIPQIKALGDVTKASDAYDDAVTKYGPHSQQAAAASQAMAAQLGKLPPETQKAAGAFLLLRNNFQSWSNSLASSTMPVFTKGLGVVNALLPKTSDLVKGASTQFNRLVTVLAGGISTPGFDALSKKFTEFANNSLKNVTDEAIHFSRVLSEGSANGPISKFMDYARSNGPAVKDTLQNLGEALLHIAEAASNAGPGMLSVINVLAKVVSALPPEVLTRFIQLYTAFRLIALTSTGLVGVGTALTTLRTTMVAAGAAGSAATGGLATFRAALATLSTGTQIGLVIAVVAGIALALNKLSSSSQRAPDVKLMASALLDLGKNGKAAGELTRTFGPDLDGLGKAIDRVSGKTGSMDKFNDTMNKILTLGHGKDSGLKDAEKNLDGLDKGLASLVQNGHAVEAAQAIKDLQEQTGKKIPTKELDNYKSALNDMNYEAKLTAESQGMFGEQAIAVQKKLDAQKRSADGLTQAILDLNDANRAGLDTEADFEQAIDDASAAVKGHGNALKFTNGQLDLSTQAARDAYAPLSKIASSAEAAAQAALQQGKSQDYANRILIRAHDQLVTTGRQMGLSTKDAEKFADSLDNIKDPKIKVTATDTALRNTISDANRRLNSMPKSKTSALRAESSQLKNVIRDAQARLNALHNKAIIIRVTTAYSSTGTPSQVYHEGGNYATGGIVRTAATGGPRSNLTWVGEHGPELADLAPGTMVHSNPDSMRMASQMGRGGGGGMAPFTIILNLGDRQFAEVLVDPLRKEVSSRGGVIAALGKL